MHHSKEALISDIQQLSLSELYRREPNLGSGAAGAIHIPDSLLVDATRISGENI
jgi:L-2-hydroxyglutarate oxidase LhgO